MSHPAKGDAAAGMEAPLGANTLFEQPWWLNAVAPGAWGAVEVSRDGGVLARLPTVIEEFELEGSVVEPVERFFRSSGVTPRSYFRIARFGRRMGFSMAGREITRALLGDFSVPGKRT